MGPVINTKQPFHCNYRPAYRVCHCHQSNIIRWEPPDRRQGQPLPFGTYNLKHLLLLKHLQFSPTFCLYPCLVNFYATPSCTLVYDFRTTLRSTKV